MIRFIWCLVICLMPSLLIAQESEMVVLKEGFFVPLYGTIDKKPVRVKTFKMDRYAVTNKQYLTFLKKHPEFRRSGIKRIFADKMYLSYWTADLEYGNHNSDAPVTNVSWFAAKKYCECMGKRLPTIDEWECAAMADQNDKDARSKESYNNYILEWYEKRNTFGNPVGQTFKNCWGVYDLHGLVWEWTSDFNSVLLSGESRKDKDTDTNLFCGSGSVNATDLMNYAAFMRYAFRASLKANYSSRNLGFRCARDIDVVKRADSKLNKK